MGVDEALLRRAIAGAPLDALATVLKVSFLVALDLQVTCAEALLKELSSNVS